MKTIVVKIGGSVASEPHKRKELLKQLIALSHNNGVVLVHGGKEQINRFLSLFKIETKFVKGQRYTDEKALGVVAAALNTVNHELVAEINSLGGCAVGFSGIDGKMIRTTLLKGLGLVGKVGHIDASLIKAMLSKKLIPVISPMCSHDAASSRYPVLNVNADSVASGIASALKADKLYFVSDVPGIYDKKLKVIPEVKINQIDILKENETISGGMLPKIDGCREALLKGVRQIVITNRIDTQGTKIVK